MKCWQWDVCKEAYYGGCRTYCNCCLGSRACICTCCCPGVCPQGKRCQDYSGTLAMSVAVLVPAAPQVPGLNAKGSSTCHALLLKFYCPTRRSSARMSDSQAMQRQRP